MKPKKSVTFSTMATVHPQQVPTEEDQKHSWYNDKDYACFEADRQRTVKALHTICNGNISSLGEEDDDEGEGEGGGEYCVIGLERTLTRRLSLERRYHTMQQRYAVLRQQHVNKKNGILYDPESIRLASEQYSKQGWMSSEQNLLPQVSAADVCRKQYQIQLLHQQQYRHQHGQQVSRSARHQILTNVLDQALQVSNTL